MTIAAAPAPRQRPRATSEDTRITIFREVEKKRDQFLSLLGNDQRLADRFITVALHAVNTNPRILECDPLTVIEAIRTSATLGLELNGVMGQAYIVPFYNRRQGKSDAQFQIGWRGLLTLIRRSGQVRSIDTQVVFANDEFALEFGSEPKVYHRPALSDRGARLGVYAVAIMASGDRIIEWLSEADVEAVRKSSKANDDGPWVTHYEEMARKSAIKRLAKRLPLEPLAEQALEVEATADATYDRPIVSRPTEGLRGAAAARARLLPGTETAPVATEPAQDGPSATEPLEVVSEATEPDLCGLASPYGDGATCIGTAGHEGLHRNDAKESWSGEPAA